VGLLDSPGQFTRGSFHVSLQFRADFAAHILQYVTGSDPFSSTSVFCIIRCSDPK
jgi:hypothetical protein